jgi:hypothetical protein
MINFFKGDGVNKDVGNWPMEIDNFRHVKAPTSIQRLNAILFSCPKAQHGLVVLYFRSSDKRWHLSCYLVEASRVIIERR